MSRVVHGGGDRRQLGRRTTLLALLLVMFALGSTRALAATGDLTYQGCLAGDTAVGPTGTSACSLIPGATSGGSNSGLDQLFGIAVSPDGTSLYAVSHLDDAIARFSRDPSTGALIYQDCISGRTETTTCTQIGSAQSNGLGSGLDEPYGVAISPNGANVYVAAQEDDSIVTFNRNTSTGALSYQGCITGESTTGPSGGGGNDSCATALPKAAAAGANSGINKVRNLAIDANGESVYATSGQDDALSHFSRNTGTGALTYVDCFTAQTLTGSSGGGGNDACADLPGISSFGNNSGFDNPQAVTVSPNGAQVYVGSGNDAGITRFNRTAGTGALAYQDCMTKDSSVVNASCTTLPGDEANGFDTGFDNIRAVAVSPDGSSLYATSGGDAAIVHFARNTGSGVLTFQGCLSGDSLTGPSGTVDCSLIPSATPNGDQSGWAVTGNAPALVIRADGAQVFFGTGGDDSVVQLDRNTGSGALTFRRCFTSETESAGGCIAISPSASNGTATGLDAVYSLAISGDGRSLYSSSLLSDAVGRFAIEPAPAPPAPVPHKKKKCKKKKKKHSASVAKKKCKKKKKKK